MYNSNTGQELVEDPVLNICTVAMQGESLCKTLCGTPEYIGTSAIQPFYLSASLSSFVVSVMCSDVFGVICRPVCAV